MNIALLLRIADRIAKQPEAFDMREWVAKSDCGAEACIAGWAMLLTDVEPAFGSSDQAHETNFNHSAELLGLSLPQAQSLFHLHRWPTEFWWEYKAAKTAEEAATVAVRRIHHFIEMGV